MELVLTEEPVLPRELVNPRLDVLPLPLVPREPSEPESEPELDVREAEAVADAPVEAELPAVAEPLLLEELSEALEDPRELWADAEEEAVEVAALLSELRLATELAELAELAALELAVEAIELATPVEALPEDLAPWVPVLPEQPTTRNPTASKTAVRVMALLDSRARAGARRLARGVRGVNRDFLPETPDRYLGPS